MAQAAIQLTVADFDSLPETLRRAHSEFLRAHREVLVTFGPIRHPDGSPAGYAYQCDFPGTSVVPMHAFLGEDPLMQAGMVHGSIARGWRCALKHRQPAMPERRGLAGFFFFSTAKPGMTEKRNSIVAAHRDYLMQVDETNCLSRGFLTDVQGTAWLGSAMVYEFPDRQALVDFFRTEPYCTHGLYERIDIFDWQRGAMAP